MDRYDPYTDKFVRDTIDRQAAIDAFLTELTERERKNLLHTWSTVEVKYFVVDMLEKLPSAQPERKKGKWIAQEDELGEYASGCFECSNCHEVFWVESGTPQDNEYNYCPNCGADMRGEQDGRFNQQTGGD